MSDLIALLFCAVLLVVSYLMMVRSKRNVSSIQIYPIGKPVRLIYGACHVVHLADWLNLPPQYMYVKQLSWRMDNGEPIIKIRLETRNPYVKIIDVGEFGLPESWKGVPEIHE